MARHKDVDWNLPKGGGDDTLSWEQAGLAVMMDIRDELRRLNEAIWCPNFIGIPRSLTRIARNTTKRRVRRRAKRASKARSPR